MASRRALLSLSVRSSQILRPQVPAARRAIAQAPRPFAAPVVAQRCVQQVRWHSAPAGAEKKSKVYEFDDIVKLVESPEHEVVLIDVREPSEYTSGFIPTAINIPIASQPDAFYLPPNEFEDRFGLQKPPPTTEVVFYCKAGVRSSAAAQLAKQCGYERVGEYRGSWLDWERKGGAAGGRGMEGVDEKKGGSGDAKV